MKENNIKHRDIKTNNILVKYLNKEKTNYKVLLCDYGISRQIASMTRKFMSHVGTHCYTAPEILNDEIYNYKCDLWSLGITIYEMYTGELPYEAESEKGLLNQIDDKGKDVLDNIKDDKLKNLLLKLLERIRIKDILGMIISKILFLMEIIKVILINAQSIRIYLKEKIFNNI